MFSQANKVRCTFLFEVDNELKDVTNASIVQPLQRKFHCMDMRPDVFRVVLAWVFPGCEELDPPYQLPGADSELKLGECSQTTTPVGTAPSQAKATTPVVADHAEAPHGKGVGIDDDDDFHT